MKNDDLLYDFSKKAIETVIKLKIFQHPFTLYCCAFGFLGILASIFAIKIPLITFLSVCLFLTGLGSLLFNYFFRIKYYTSQYFDNISRQMEEQRDKVVNELIKKLTKYNTDKELSKFSKQGITQYEKMKDKIEYFKNFLKTKFNPEEFAFHRILGTSTQLYLSALDNLESIGGFLEIVKSIDADYIEERLRDLKSLKKLDDADKREMETLQKRKEIRDSQLNKINELLTINEEAMTQIDTTLTSLNTIKGKSNRHASISIEKALLEMENATKIAKKVYTEMNQDKTYE